MDNRSFGILLAVWAFMLLATLYVMVYYHESAHMQINRYLGIPDTKMTMGLMGGFVSSHTSDSALGREAIRYHALNEIAGYNILAIILSVFCVGLFFLLIQFAEDD